MKKQIQKKSTNGPQHNASSLRSTTQLKRQKALPSGISFTAAPAQLYSAYGDDANRMSDDKKMAVEGAGTGNALYVDDSLIKPTNEKLKSKNAAARVQSGGKKKKVGPEDEQVSLTPVKLMNAGKTKKFEHEDGCSDEAYKLMGTTEGNAYPGGNPRHLYKNVLNHALDKKGDRNNVDAKQIDRSGEERETARKALGGDYMPFKNLYYHFVVETDVELNKGWTKVQTKLAEKSTGTAQELITAMEQVLSEKPKSGSGFPAAFNKKNIGLFGTFILAEEDTKDLLGKHSPDTDTPGLNDKAKPDVGEAYLIMSGGKNKKNEFTWNYHWGAVTMKSGSDTVTTESYAGNEDLRGVWGMYGTNKGQSFHEEHAATDLHGDKPLTVATHVQNGKLIVGSETDVPEEQEQSKKLKKNPKEELEDSSL